MLGTMSFITSIKVVCMPRAIIEYLPMYEKKNTLLKMRVKKYIANIPENELQ